MKRWILIIVCLLFLFSCAHRTPSQIRPDMTKEEVIRLWGETELVTYQRIQDKTIEIWEYHFGWTGNRCGIAFLEDRVISTKCNYPQHNYSWIIIW